MEQWESTKPAFVTYYKKKWHGKVWTVKFRQYKHTNQNTNRGVKHWHHTLKLKLKVDKYTISGRSVIWLLIRTRMLENHYYCISSLKFQGRIKNRTIEKYVWDSIHKAWEIPNNHVFLFEFQSQHIARVRSVLDPTKEHLVTNFDKDSCECTWECTYGHSLQGNACNHQLKVLIMIGLMTKTQILKPLGTKMGTYCGGLDFHFNKEKGSLIPPGAANITIPSSNSKFWDNDNRDVKGNDEAVVPLLKDFERVMKSLFDEINHAPSLLV